MRKPVIKSGSGLKKTLDRLLEGIAFIKAGFIFEDYSLEDMKEIIGFPYNREMMKRDIESLDNIQGDIFSRSFLNLTNEEDICGVAVPLMNKHKYIVLQLETITC